MVTSGSVRWLPPVLVAVLLAPLLVVTPPAAEATTTLRTKDEQRVEKRLFENHNRARANPGAYNQGGTPVAPLLWAHDVAEVARAWSDEMARTGAFEHNPSYTSQTCCWTMIGENIIVTWPLRVVRHPRAARRRVHAGLDGLRRAPPEHHDRGLRPRRHRRDPHVRRAGLRHGGVPQGEREGPEGLDHLRPPDGGDAEAQQRRERLPGRPRAGLGVHRRQRQPGPAHRLPEVVERHRRHHPDHLPARRTVTREQMASFIARSIRESGGSLPTTASHRFRDVDPTSTHAAAINALAAAGVIDGYRDGTYRPTAPVERGHMAKFLVQSYEYRTGKPLPIADAGLVPRRRRLRPRVAHQPDRRRRLGRRLLRRHLPPRPDGASRPHGLLPDPLARHPRGQGVHRDPVDVLATSRRVGATASAAAPTSRVARTVVDHGIGRSGPWLRSVPVRPAARLGGPPCPSSRFR
jgi:hypothetical protein